MRGGEGDHTTHGACGHTGRMRRGGASGLARLMGTCRLSVSEKLMDRNKKSGRLDAFSSGLPKGRQWGEGVVEGR